MYTIPHLGMKQAVDALVQAGVKHFVFLSSYTVQDKYLKVHDHIAERHHNVEQTIKSHSGVTYTFIRGGGFASNVFMFWGKQLKSGAPISLIGDDGFHATAIAEEDMATIAVRSLTSTDLDNQAVPARGPHILTHRQHLDMIGKVWGVKPSIQSLSEQDYKDHMKSHIPYPSLVDSIVRIGIDPDTSKEGDVNETKKALQRDPMDFETYLKLHKHEFDAL